MKFGFSSLRNKKYRRSLRTRGIGITAEAKARYRKERRKREGKGEEPWYKV